LKFHRARSYGTGRVASMSDDPNTVGFVDTLH
jgi:hypothetical protein